MVAGFISERWPASRRNTRPASIGICSGDEPKEQKGDFKAPEASLAETVQEALKKARAAMPAVTDPCDRGEIAAVLEQMLDEAKSLPWLPPEF
jgi:hypothetical protein